MGLLVERVQNSDKHEGGVVLISANSHSSEILAAYKKSYTDAVAMHFDGDSFMALSHKRQALLRSRYGASILFPCYDCHLMS